MTSARCALGALICSLGMMLLAACGGGTCGGGGGSQDVCPPPVYGYALVRGQVLRSDGSPVGGKQASVGCGEVVGAYSDYTSSDGRFEVRPVYAVDDTVLYPFPPRNPDGSFELSCQAGVLLAGDILVRQSGVGVRFAPAPQAVVPTTVELREGGTQ